MSVTCTDNVPCRHYDLCAGCQAKAWLTEEDWYLVRFYHHVADQVTEGGLPRLEGYAAAFSLHGYPESVRYWLIRGAVMLHRLMTKQDEVNWRQECGKDYRHIGPGDVTDGD